MNGRRAKLIRKEALKHPEIIKMGPLAFHTDTRRFAFQDRKTKAGGAIEQPAFASPYKRLCRFLKRQHQRAHAR